TPSTSINGDAPPCVCNDPLTPRNRIVGSPPKSPLGVETDKPETAPCKARPTSVIGRVSNVFSVSTVDTAPVIFERRCEPYPAAIQRSSRSRRCTQHVSYSHVAASRNTRPPLRPMTGLRLPNSHPAY